MLFRSAMLRRGEVLVGVLRRGEVLVGVLRRREVLDGRVEVYAYVSSYGVNVSCRGNFPHLLVVVSSRWRVLTCRAYL